LIRSRLSIITADVSIENFRQATQRERPASIDYNPRSYIALACHNADSFLEFVEKSIARLLLALLHWCACYSASLGRQSKPSRSDPRVGRCDPSVRGGNASWKKPCTDALLAATAGAASAVTLKAAGAASVARLGA
jgi:hypothetical protein